MKHVLILLPALIHVIVFLLESAFWGRSWSNKLFRVTEEQAQVVKLWAFNQGFYNLFLAAAVFAGWVLIVTDYPILASPPGVALVVFGNAAMIAAGLVLVFSSRARFLGAIFQIVPAAAGLVALFFVGP